MTITLGVIFISTIVLFSYLEHVCVLKKFHGFEGSGASFFAQYTFWSKSIIYVSCFLLLGVSVVTLYVLLNYYIANQVLVIVLSCIIIVASNLCLIILFNKLRKKTINVHEKAEHVPQDQEERLQIMQNVLDFSSIKLRECMVPRTELECIELQQSLDELRQKFIESGYSKILVFKESIDNIIGFVHNADLFSKPHSIEEILRPIQYVPESMNAKKTLMQLLQNKQSIALVVDEFGGTAGIVTIEDMIEEIFGEIKDEFDADTFVEKQISDTEFIFSARIEIDYINEKYALNIPVNDDYETLAGFFLYHYQTFPHVYSHININNLKFTVLQISETRIALLNVKKI
ncbi:MAG: CBS domain-containing protein [Bacteroidales bacterium]|jgi:CBS domain containing-hemolysin-like protein|nr:CBS domain-containing protein [Bacteroidales bacterium]